jgi:Pentapeptide repeats (8 copies)
MDTKNNTGKWNTGNCNAGNWNTGNWNAGDRNAGNWNAGNWNAGSRNAGDWNAGNWNAGSRNAGDWNAGNWNAGDRNAGNWNAGNWNAGFFNTITPSMVMVFNGHMVGRAAFLEKCPPWLSSPRLTSWVDESDMTDQEKIDYPTFHTCGGYLRTNDWNAEWEKALADASADDVQKVRDLPGFDYDVFQEITGLDLRLTDEPKHCDEITINGVRYIKA